MREQIEKSKQYLAAEKALEQAKHRLAEAKKAENAKRRKYETHYKCMMGGIVAKVFPDCYGYGEKELYKIIYTAMNSQDCERVIQQIEEDRLDEGSDEGGRATGAGYGTEEGQYNGEN